MNIEGLKKIIDEKYVIDVSSAAKIICGIEEHGENIHVYFNPQSEKNKRIFASKKYFLKYLVNDCYIAEINGKFLVDRKNFDIFTHEVV
jgi:hypothetical protein